MKPLQGMKASDDETGFPVPEPGNERAFSFKRFFRLAIIALLFSFVLLAGYYGWGLMRMTSQAAAPPDPRTTLLTPAPVGTSAAWPSGAGGLEILPSLTPGIQASPSLELPTATLPPIILEPTPAVRYIPGKEVALLALNDGLYSHLYSFSPRDGSFTRLTDGPWRDITPSASPDGQTIAFASNRSGYWDLYLLRLNTGEVQQLTDSHGYDGSPSWSPDNLWLAYESYVEKDSQGDLEIFIQPLDGSQHPIRLTDDPAADHSPAWSPQGRRVAFVSTRSGEAEIWMADLDQVDDRYQNLSRSSGSIEAHPVWSPDGEQLAWAAVEPGGLHVLRVWSARDPERRPPAVNSGDWPVFTPDGQGLLTGLETPNRSYLTGYRLNGGELSLPILRLPGGLSGLTFLAGGLPEPLPGPIQAAAQLEATPLWSPAVAAPADLPKNRYAVVDLKGVDPGNLKLHDGVDDSFYALRLHLAEQLGWDFLSSLEAAFAPLSAPPGPGMLENWLYTGRAFRFNTAPINAGWLAIVREDYGPETYWRVYLRVRFQDGLQGEPVHFQTWDLAGRHSGDPLAYEAGGRLMPSAPDGYWVDFTRLAAAHGWERVPALSSWRSAYSSVRYNEYVLLDGQDWLSAMLEVYPKAALDTPTPVSSPTITSTPSITPYPSATSTRPPYRSPTPTLTITRRPTFTPTSTPSPWPTRTPTPTGIP